MGSLLCAYVGVPIDHPLAGQDYDNVPIRCHGGLTYAGKGDGEYRPKGYYWYGWDYAHSDDYCFYYDKLSLMESKHHLGKKKWGVKDVEQDMWSSVYDFRKVIKLVEAVTKEAKRIGD